jgi:hypothetical protein
MSLRKRFCCSRETCSASRRKIGFERISWVPNRNRKNVSDSIIHRPLTDIARCLFDREQQRVGAASSYASDDAHLRRVRRITGSCKRLRRCRYSVLWRAAGRVAARAALRRQTIPALAQLLDFAWPRAMPDRASQKCQARWLRKRLPAQARWLAGWQRNVQSPEWRLRGVRPPHQ